FAIAARDSRPADRCVGNGERHAVSVSLALEPGAADVAVKAIGTLVDGRTQSVVRGASAWALLRRGTLHWQTRTPAGAPFMVAGRHVGTVELVAITRSRRGPPAVARRTRLSLPDYVRIC